MLPNTEMKLKVLLCFTVLFTNILVRYSQLMFNFFFVFRTILAVFVRHLEGRKKVTEDSFLWTEGLHLNHPHYFSILVSFFAAFCGVDLLFIYGNLPRTNAFEDGKSDGKERRTPAVEDHPTAIYRTPEFRWSNVHLRLLADLLTSIEGVVNEWKEYVTVLIFFEILLFRLFAFFIFRSSLVHLWFMFVIQ